MYDLWFLVCIAHHAEVDLHLSKEKVKDKELISDYISFWD